MTTSKNNTAATSFETRISAMFSQVEDIISIVDFSEACFDLKVSQFNTLENDIEICIDTGNMCALEAVIEGLLEG